MNVQVEVFIPFGGQKLVKLLAWHPAASMWVDIYTATECGVDVSVSGSAAVFEYVLLRTNPCRTTFPVDTLRLVFETDLTKQSLMVGITLIPVHILLVFGVCVIYYA